MWGWMVDQNGIPPGEATRRAAGLLARLQRLTIAEPVEWVELIDVPDTDSRWFIACRWFKTLDGERVERDEIVSPFQGFWATHSLPPRAFDLGRLQPLKSTVHARRCICDRFWATQAALVEHGCSELPSEETNRPPLSGPRAPIRAKDLTRWRQTWRTIRPEYERSKSYAQISEWLHRSHKDLAVGADKIADICRAGAAGLLD